MVLINVNKYVAFEVTMNFISINHRPCNNAVVIPSGYRTARSDILAGNKYVVFEHFTDMFYDIIG